ncbi:hypothetical protein BDF22DRAFT_663280 [Syncephalis plumigaleata]|nr:hypothetical protein BDF22DRAFT_663280 [Syncephalis plumigaleata]
MRYFAILIGGLLPLVAAARYSINEPNGLTVWKIGSEVSITWSYQADDKTAAGSSIKLELYRVGEGVFGRDRLINTITGELAASVGTARWTAPDVDTSKQYYVQLQRLNSGLFPDRATSGKFKIQSANENATPTSSSNVPSPTTSIVVVTPTVFVNETMSAKCLEIQKECERQTREYVNCSCGELLDFSGASQSVSFTEMPLVLLASWSVALVVIGQRYFLQLV